MKTRTYYHQPRSSVLFGLSTFIRSITWLLVVIVLVSMLGRFIWLRTAHEAGRPATERTRAVARHIDWSQVDTDLVAAVETSRQTAHHHASEQLDAWIQQLSKRIDERFLPWYFNYWTQKKIGFKGLGYWMRERDFVERFIGEQPSAAERITEDIQDHFARHVLRPVIAQMELERMTREMIEVYFAELREHLKEIEVRHQIPHPQWTAYLNDLALLAEAGKPETTPLTMKTVYTSVSAGSLTAMITMADAIRHKIHAVGAKCVARQATAGTAKAAGATAAKTGAKTSAKLGGKMLGPIVLIGIVAWDVAEHRSSRNEAEPILRKNLNDYLAQLHNLLLNDSENGMMAVLHSLEVEVARQKSSQ